MRYLMMLFIVVLSKAICLGQKGEFDINTTGLMYSETTMTQLKFIVDSLNLKFRSCDLNKVYYTKYQAKGHYIYLKGADAEFAKKDLENNISWENFIQKYPQAKPEKELLITKFRYINYKDESTVEFSTVPLNNTSEHTIHVADKNGIYDKKVKGQWMFDYWDDKNKASESLRAFFFMTEFEKKALPEKYAKLVQYVDCMVDTTGQIFKKKVGYGNYTPLPQNLQTMPLKKKKQLLEELRGTKVVGGCSMDDSPRQHARNIAILSAETINWEIFLRAHLDIMNDRFERVTDGSYAWAGRQTYIQELEELDINVDDLLLGISLRIENPSQNHYYGNVGRLGRALAESKKANEMENKILLMIKDNSLDDYNRLIMYYLFLNYNYYLENEQAKAENLNKLREAVKELPEYLSGKIKIDK